MRYRYNDRPSMRHSDLRQGDVLIGNDRFFLVIGRAGHSEDYRVLVLTTGEVCDQPVVTADTKVDPELELIREGI